MRDRAKGRPAKGERTEHNGGNINDAKDTRNLGMRVLLTTVGGACGACDEVYKWVVDG